jgi:hypothetical protein
MLSSFASRSHRDNVGWQIPLRIESADAVGPPGSINFFTMLALKASLYSVTVVPQTPPCIGVSACLSARRTDRTTPLTQGVTAIADWCRSHRHLPVKQQHAALVRRIDGHCNYFGVNGNSRSLEPLLFYAETAWHKWLSRRSQRAYLNGTRFHDLLRDFPLPRPTIRVQLWATP